MLKSIYDYDENEPIKLNRFEIRTHEFIVMQMIESKNTMLQNQLMNIKLIIKINIQNPKL